MPKSKLIFSADDFGQSRLTNKNILKLIERDKIDRVAIFADGDFNHTEIQKLIDSKTKLDIHLKLPASTRGGREVILKRFISFASNFFLGKNSPKKVRDDWREQIKRFKDVFGQNPDGLNSHEHVHFFPSYFKVSLKLAQEFDIPYVRFSQKGIIKTKNPISKILGLFHKINLIRWKKNKKKLETSDHLASFDWINNFEEFQKKLPEGEIEVVCHPEHEFEKLKGYENLES